VIPRLNVELACGHPFAVLNDWQPRLGQWITCRECQGQRKIVGWSAAGLPPMIPAARIDAEVAADIRRLTGGAA
jgi:hypothetical protein